jgi:NADH-quinone oxidoreductase subunit F
MIREDLSYVDQQIARHGRSADAVLGLLHDLQDHFGYLPAAALERICEQTDITPENIVGVGSFYDAFRTRPGGKHALRICHGTACHVKGAPRVEDAIRLHLNIPDDHDTDPEQQFTVQRVACVGCCSLAPVIQIDRFTAGELTARTAPAALEQFRREADRGATPLHPPTAAPDAAGEVWISLDSCCLVRGTDRLFRAAIEATRKLGVPVNVRRTGCMGLCRSGASLVVADAHGVARIYTDVAPDQVGELLAEHFPSAGVASRVMRLGTRAIDWLVDQQVTKATESCALTLHDDRFDAAEARQVRIATEHYGRLDPLDLDQYIAHGGFEAWRSAVAQNDPDRLIETIAASGLRGRGGGGYPTGRKWRQVADQPDPVRYAICNGDEGDPGAFMDRMLMEAFPFRVVEGLALSAFAVGAEDAYFYIRHEYPLAVERIGRAIDQCNERGLLGNTLRLHIREGAGAFVCGEETALIASIEGRRGTPEPRPPYPAQRGLWGKPTIVNNVETLANLSWILRHGPEAFASHGTAKSKGTKVFALAGSVRRGGLVEVPMGTTVHDIVFEIGGGIQNDRAFKAIQIGGPSGGCLPASMAHTPIDYEALADAGAIMGSGGLIVLDERDCMVDLARYFLAFTQDQSCGKCSLCRVGTRRMLEILDRICEGRGRADDLDELEHLAVQVGAGSLCGLGATAPNPVLTTLRYFRDEFEAHLDGRCPAGRCTKLIRYEITDACVGCTLCATACPVDAIPLTPYSRHSIDDSLCTRCDSCRVVCPHDAVVVR